MDFFEMRVFFWQKIKNFKNWLKKIQFFRYSAKIGNTHLLLLHNEPSPMPVG